MGFSDRLKDLKGKAEEAAAEHNDQIRGAISKAASTADQKTGGKYSEKIGQAGAKADAFVGGFADGDGAPAGEPAATDAEQPPA